MMTYFIASHKTRELSVQETAKIFKNLKEGMKRLKAVKPEQNSSELLLLGSLQCKHHGPKEIQVAWHAGACL